MRANAIRMVHADAPDGQAATGPVHARVAWVWVPFKPKVAKNAKGAQNDCPLRLVFHAPRDEEGRGRNVAAGNEAGS